MQVRGLCLRREETFIRTGIMPSIKNLDDIPFASAFIKDNLNERDYFFAAATYPSIQIFTGRGCPFHCNFVCIHRLCMGISSGHVLQRMSWMNLSILQRTFQT